MDVGARLRRVSLVAITCLASCNVGLDPARLERLEYGMPHGDIAAALESEQTGIPLVRCFVPDAQGRLQDVLVELHETPSPHPCYLLVSIDGRLAATTLASAYYHPLVLAPESASPSDRTWQPFARRDSETVVLPWRPAELRTLLDAILAARVPLAWESLEPLDRAQSAKRPLRGTTALEASLFVLPMVLYLPYWLYLNTLGDEGWERAESMRARLLAAPATTTSEEIVTALGEPDSDRIVTHPEGVHRVIGWQFGRFSINAGFLEDRLLWSDFGHWRNWVHEFME